MNDSDNDDNYRRISKRNTAHLEMKVNLTKYKSVQIFEKDESL